MSMRCGAWSNSPGANNRPSIAKATGVRKSPSRTAEASTTITAGRVRRAPRGLALSKERPRTPCQAGAQFLDSRPFGGVANFLEQVVRQRLALERRARVQAPMQRVRHVADLDHSGHAQTWKHVLRMQSPWAA